MMTDAISRLLEHDDEGVRMNAASIFGFTNSSAVVPLIRALADDPSPQVRGNAAASLGYLGDAHAIQPLLTALTDNAPNVRYHAVQALGDIGDGRALAVLEQLQQNDTQVFSEPQFNISVSQAAQIAIRKIKERVAEG